MFPKEINIASAEICDGFVSARSENGTTALKWGDNSLPCDGGSLLRVKRGPKILAVCAGCSAFDPFWKIVSKNEAL